MERNFKPLPFFYLIYWEQKRPTGAKPNRQLGCACVQMGFALQPTLLATKGWFVQKRNE